MPRPSRRKRPTVFTGIDPNNILTVYQRTRDETSNEVVFFDVSNLFYGNEIQPESLVLTDENALSGTNGRVGITLKDNGAGSLYRADAATPHPLWASVGNVIYPEGLVVLMHPVLNFFGKDSYQIDLRGSFNVHTMKLTMYADAAEINSSSNPSFTPVSATLDANDGDPDFVYVTGVYIHDDNLNVVAKVNLAQPVVKRTSDAFAVRLRHNF